LFILWHFLKSASLQLLGESCLVSRLPMFRCHRVVLVWLLLHTISFGYRFITVLKKAYQRPLLLNHNLSPCCSKSHVIFQLLSKTTPFKWRSVYRLLLVHQRRWTSSKR
jgi:hypothetical protein